MLKGVFPVATIFLAFAAIEAGAADNARAKPLPFEAAFNRPEIRAPVIVSPTGAYFAVEVRRQPDDHDFATADATVDPSGKPASVHGSRVLVYEAGSRTPAAVLDDADSWRASWSPDGLQLAFFSDAEGAIHVWVFDVASRESRRVSDLVIKAREWAGSHARWSLDGRSLFVSVRSDSETPPRESKAATLAETQQAGGARVHLFQANTEAASDKAQNGEETGDSDDALKEWFHWIHNGHLVKLDAETGEAQILVPVDADPRPSALRLSPSGRWMTYLTVPSRKSPVATQLDMGVVAIPIRGEGGEPVLVTDGEPMIWPYYELTYRWGPTEDRLVFFRDQAVWAQDYRQTKPTAAIRLAPSLGPLGETVLTFTRDGESVIVATVDPEAPINRMRNSGPTLTGFHQASLNGGEPVEIALDLTRWDFQQFVTVDGSVLWQPRGEAVYVHVSDRKNGDQVILRLEPGRGAAAEVFCWDGRLSTINGTPDHSGVTAVLENLNTAPDVYYLDSRFRAPKRLTEINPAASDVDVGDAHRLSVRVPTWDGSLQEVDIAVLMPPGAMRGDRVPAIVDFYPDMDMTHQARRFMGGNFHVPWGLYTSRGYAVIFTHTLTGPGNEAGDVLKELTDSLLPQVYAATHAGYVDVKRLALTGNSFGGYATAGVVARTNLFRAAIPHNGPYDLGGANYSAFKDLSSGPIWQTWFENSQPRMGTHPWADVRRVIDNSPYYQADKIRTPTLIMQGGSDIFVREAQMLYTALSRLGQPVELAIYEDSGHVLSYWPRANAIDGAKRILRFLEEHLGPGFSAR